ncbi:MAG: CapA family protein [Oscillospiraceae bacterium]|nr:CapA family protein [Oscillospiraceae bacterium]
MKFTAAGDAIIQKRIAEDFPGYDELIPFIAQGDARFFNLETTLNHVGEAWGGQFSGGTYIRMDPEVLEDLMGFGFNMTTANNNHAMDFSYEGLELTLEALESSGLVHSGLGRNLAEASAPRYLETKNGRVALIAVNTSFNPTCMAGEQSSRFPGRPGINGLRIESHLELPQEDLAIIQRIATQTNINAEKEITRKEGYFAELATDEAELGELKFKLGDVPRFVQALNEADMRRIQRAIYEAKLQADYIMISIHSHQLSGDAKENPADFLQEFAHRCIDMGAHAIVGHGPHLLRPIEVYKDCPIFYSLGDFILQLYQVEAAPEDFFAKHGMHHHDTVHDLLKHRSKGFTVGLMTDPRMFRSVIPCWETEDGKLKKLTLLPIEMKMAGKKGEMGLPRRSFNPEIATYLDAMCRPFGTQIHQNPDGTLSVTW